MSEWKTIETAPQDGTDIILFGEHVEVGSYRLCDGLETWCDSGQIPTHWMPLPNPPQSATEARA